MAKIEIIAIVAVVAILVWLILPEVSHRGANPLRIRCVNNLKNIGLAFRIFATDNNDRFPTAMMLTNGTVLEKIDALRVFLTLSNELSEPKILHCPADKDRRPAQSFTNLTLENLSYFVSLTASETNANAFLAGDRNLASNGVPLGAGMFPVTTNAALSWTKEIHKEQGDIVMGDGSVQQFSSSRLRQAVRDQDIAAGRIFW